jgi:hypothetical protein
VRKGSGCPIHRLVWEVTMFSREHIKTYGWMMQIPNPSPQDMACLRTIYIVRYGPRDCYATDHDRAPKSWGPRNVTWIPFTGSEYILITYAVMSVQC